MSTFELKEGAGNLFKNTKKEAETHADYQGTIKIGGNEYYLNAWVKEGKNGKFFSLSAKVKTPKPSEAKQEKPVIDPKDPFGGFDDQIPFNQVDWRLI